MISKFGDIMSYSFQRDLKTVEDLLDKLKYTEALEVLNELLQSEKQNSEQKFTYQVQKGKILLMQGRYEEVNEISKLIIKEGEDFNNRLQSFDGLNLLFRSLLAAGNNDEALETVEQAEKILNSLPDLSQKELILRKARILNTKSNIYYLKGEIETAENWLTWIISLQQDFGVIPEIIYAHIVMAMIMDDVYSEFHLALEHNRNALSLAEEINDHFGIALSHLIFGMTYGDIGEFELSLKESKKSLTLFKKINNKKWIATLLNNIGYISAIMGDYDLALEYLEQSLILLEEFNPMGVDYILDSLIFACLEKGDFNQAQQYFQRLEYIYEQKKERSLVTTYLYNKALMLKISPRIRDIAEAEKLFKQVIEEEIFSFDITIKAFIHLCDLLLKELRLTNDIGVVEELDLYITQLLTIAEKSHSYYILCETYMLQAKLALLTLDLDESQRLLIQAQQIAERYGIKRLAIKISNEHDQLLKQLKKWERAWKIRLIKEINPEWEDLYYKLLG